MPQHRLEHLLAERAVRFGAAVLRGHEVAGFEQNNAGVTVQAVADGSPLELRTRYLVGCDGARSFVRKSLGIGVVVTADALHCQRDHVTYLAGRGAHWILTVKGNQPSLHQQLAGLPWRLVPTAVRDTDRGHGRREIRTLKILSVSTGIDLPNAAQAIQIRRRRRRLDEPGRFTTETVYAITDLPAHQAKPAHLADWIRGHWSIENKVHWVRDVTYDEDRSQIRTGNGPQVMAAIRNAAIGALRLDGATNIAAANRHHARDANRPVALLGIA